jgi:hypothetical protein
VESELPVLHTLRVRGFASPEQIAESSGLDLATIRSVLDDTAAQGHTRHREGRISGHSLTPAGRARYGQLRSGSLPAQDARAVEAAYASFIGPNQELKELITGWQLHPGEERDPVVSRLEGVHKNAVPILDQLGNVAPRFGCYQARLAAALAAFGGGDNDALARPMTGSYHDVWMELHEDLLATLGRERTSDDG